MEKYAYHVSIEHGKLHIMRLSMDTETINGPDDIASVWLPNMKNCTIVYNGEILTENN